MTAEERSAAVAPAVAGRKAKLSPADRRAIAALGGAVGGKARARALTKRERSQSASQAASAISPEAARARALKAWQSKRRKLAKSGRTSN
jgi:hypothetical protein